MKDSTTTKLPADSNIDQSATPETHETPTIPTPEAQTEAQPTTNPPHPDPQSLSLWELMRKDVIPTHDDASSQVLTNMRQSIWDLD